MNDKIRQEIVQAICKNPILRASEDVDQLLADPGFHLETFGAGRVIFSPEQEKIEFALIVKGSVQITKEGVDTTVFMKRSTSGACFGVAGLFGARGQYASTVTALERQTKIAFFSEDAIRRLLEREPDAAIAYITFLSERIRYLHEKIDSFSQPNSLLQLAEYLARENKVDGGIQKLAQTLAVSRATLYRQIAKLEACGAVEKQGKQILVKNMEMLEEIIKGEKS